MNDITKEDIKHEVEDKPMSSEEHNEEVARLSKEVLDYKDKFLRLAAEFDNYKKANERDKQQAIKFGNESILLTILPVIDNLEQALSCKEDISSSVITGVEMVVKMLKDSLSKYGLTSFNSLHEVFDPNIHEAIGEQESQDHAPGVVITEYQKGYMLHGRLLRPARVVVAKLCKVD